MPDIPKLLETFKSHPPTKPNFFSTHSVTLPHALPVVYAKLGQSTSETVEAIARLSDLCSDFNSLGADQVVLHPGPGADHGSLLSATCRNAPAALAHTPAWGSNESAAAPAASETHLPRQFFHLTESVPLLFGLYTHAIHVVGCQTSDEGARETLYESLTDGGIHIRKTRRFVALSEGEGDGESSTRVDEVIEGHCGAVLRPIVDREAKRSHK